MLLLNSLFKKITLIILFTSLFLPCVASQADPVVELNELMAKLTTLNVDFSLEIHDQSTKELLDESSGTLIVKRPGFFNVHTKEPFEQFIISDRNVIWTYDVELEQATQEPVDERLQQTPFLLLSGDVDAIRKNFQVAEPKYDGKARQFSLSPVDENASYNNVILDFNDEDTLIRMQWDNTLGEQSTINFHNIKINTAITDAIFQFQPPEGVEIEIKQAANPSL